MLRDNGAYLNFNSSDRYKRQNKGFRLLLRAKIIWLIYSLHFSVKKNCWCQVAEVQDTECVVDTWDGQYTVGIDDLLSLRLRKKEKEQMLSWGERMSALSEVGELSEAVLWVLKGLEKLERAELTPLEQKLLELLEDEYLRE